MSLRPLVLSCAILLALAAEAGAQQPAGEGLVVCGGHKAAAGERKNGVMVIYDKRKTIEKDLRGAGYGQILAAMSHWSDISPALKIHSNKYAAFYDRNIASHGPDLAFGDLGQRNRIGEVAKFCVVAKPMKVCEDFTAC